MNLFRISLFIAVAGCSSVQTERAITTAQYFTPLAVGVVAIQSFGSTK